MKRTMRPCGSFPDGPSRKFLLPRSTSQWLTVRVNGTVWLSPPDVPVIVSVALVGGAGPPPRLLASNHVAMNMAKPTVATTRTGRAGRLCDRLIRQVSIDASRKSGADAATATGNLEALGREQMVEALRWRCLTKLP